MPRSTEIVGEKTNSTGLIIHRIIAYVVLVLLVVVSLFPFYLLIINATRGRSQAGIRWYPDHFLATNFKNLFSGSTASLAEWFIQGSPYDDASSFEIP